MIRQNLRPVETQDERRASRHERNVMERERQQLLEQERGEMAATGSLGGAIPSDLYSVRKLPGAYKGGDDHEGRERLRETYRYWQVLDPTAAIALVGSTGPDEGQLLSWAAFLHKYVSSNFRKPLKMFVKRKMIQEMVENKNGFEGIKCRITKKPATSFESIKKFLKEEIKDLSVEHFDEVIRRLFYVMYGMFRAKFNQWMIKECMAIMEKRRLTCKFICHPLVPWACLPSFTMFQS